MPDIFLLIVILLFGLAVTDLIVGVSNDAVNFLNSAVGSKVASRKTIMIVASLGILVGATFSSGMMEVARSGIFNPQYFQFTEIMILFLAVMLTDIILLDLFNTFGLPTSTTVSIVFELLGAAVMIAVIKTMSNGEGLGAVSSYINSSNALTIILGIFLSIGIAFTMGVALQYLSRLLFTFHYQKRLNWVAAVWSGLALVAMTYFLIIKGLKGASFVPESFVSWVARNTPAMLLLSFVFWTALMQVLVSVFRINILRLVVLFGTFSMAMAFAGNDLVNFIGVPVAGFESYNAWSGAGVAADDYNMAVLQGAYRTNPWLLLAAGMVMILTLWLSKKARSVTETEVNLGRQHEGLERFSPNWLAQIIVRGIYGLGRAVGVFIPVSWVSKSEDSFRPALAAAANGQVHDRPAFDLVRAAVNLTMASALIALATSYKMPLSTTYVSFMVAMGTSLADRAWGRDSAVYRVAGVLNVIGGWFATALIAFAAAALFAWWIHTFRLWGILTLVAMACFFIYRTFTLHRRREKEKERLEAAQVDPTLLPATQVINETAIEIAGALEVILQAYRKSLDGLQQEDLSALRVARKSIKKIRKENEEFKYTFHSDIRRMEEKFGEASRIYLLVYDLEQDIIQSISFIANACRNHVQNTHSPLSPQQTMDLTVISKDLDHYLKRIIHMLKNSDYQDYRQSLELKRALLLRIEELLAHQVEGIKREAYNARNSLLYFSLLLETKDLVAVAARFAKLYARLQNHSPEEPLVLLSKEI